MDPHHHANGRWLGLVSGFFAPPIVKIEDAAEIAPDSR
jgi:hypothetical protein